MCKPALKRWHVLSPELVLHLFVCAGLDAVVVLELDDEALAVKRALGRRVDPLTGRVYHLEFDVPPPKEPGLAARLKASS